MSDLRIETWTLPAADLGRDNPLPPLAEGADVHAVDPGSGVPADMAANMRYGRVPNALPYTVQDGYSRRLAPRPLRVAVLENEHLRAAFMLELGGRLWSLVHKPSGRELLERNPAFQPANLAIRNAWFSGGVEWNTGLIGHCPFTCSPIFAAALRRPDGAPVLRLYEWERIRQTPFQIDAFLPAGSPVLFVHVRISNPLDRETAAYWWSNIAVPETDGTRVIVPADSAFRLVYGPPHRIELAPVPVLDGTDVSRPRNLNRSADFFFHIPDGRRPWVAALERDGTGLVQTSTARLAGRKLFVWGMGAGGRHWQSFLSGPGRAYIEIQAGLARTQAEHLPMPAGAEWTWLEAYGPLRADPAAIHGADWRAAQAAVEAPLEALIPAPALEAEYARSLAFQDQVPAQVLQRGSGWGALEERRRAADGARPGTPAGIPFGDEGLGVLQGPWLALLETGLFPASDPDDEPAAFMVQTEWAARLEASVARPGGSNWEAWFHLGIMRKHAGDRAGARAAWLRSMECLPTPWACRNLAAAAREDGDAGGAAELLERACLMRPACLPLAVECAQAMLAAGRPGDWLRLLADLPGPVRQSDRIRLLEARTALETGEFDRVRSVLDDGLVISDLREGEVSLSEIWLAYHEKRLAAQEGVPVDDALRERVRRDFPVPADLDFRMTADPS